MVTQATLVTDPVHNTTQLKQTHYQYDTKGNLLQTREVYNGSYVDTYCTYDQYGNMLSKKDANGNILYFEYKAAAPYNSTFLTAVKRADGTVIATYDYDVDIGKRTRATDPKGNVFLYTYDAVGRLTSETLVHSDSKVAVTRQISYDDVNNIVSLKYGNDSAGWQEGRIVYDPLFAKPTQIQRKLNGGWVTVKESAYDTNGRLATAKDNLGHTTSYGYDELDRLIKTTFPDGTFSTASWDDRTVTTTDANGNQKTQTYDLLDRLIQVIEHPDANTSYSTTYTYDSFDDPLTDKTDSRLIQVTNARNVKTTYTYDNLGRLTRVDYPQDGTNPLAAEVYTYDNVGNLKTKTVGSRTKTMNYEFFAGYRLKSVTEPDNRTVSYTYDNNDNVLTQTVSNVSYTYTYDARNRVTGLTAVLDGRNFVFGYGYDTFGRMTSITYPNRTAPVTYQYDELDRLLKIPGFVNSCSYDGDNKLLQMVYTNGVANNYTYDVNDRPTNIKAGQGNLLNLSYTYDPVGNITQINTDYYNYDGLNRLTWYGNKPLSQLSSANGTRWNYDGAGNMASKTKFLNGASQGVTSFSYDLANRLWTMGTTSYTNDAFGARIGKANGDTWQYLYDGESRLTKVTKNAATQVESVYDGNGMRIKKIEGGKTVYYLYSGANPLMEYSPNDGSYLYRIYAGKTAVAEEKGGVVKFYHKDHLGSTRVVTNAAGAKIAEYKFAPYGEKEVASGDGTEYGFTDKAEDAASGLKYFGARFYDSEVGRFITADTYTNLPNDERNFYITADKSFMMRSDDLAEYNQYAYCQNNPINRVDPDGHFAFVLAATPEIIEAAIMGIGATVTLVETIKEAIRNSSTIGKYSDVANPRTGVREGGNFTRRQKQEILEKNKQRNGGQLVSDKSGKQLNPPTQSKKGQKANPDEAQVDHIKSKANGGTNSSSNGQVLSREENLSKGSKDESEDEKNE
ncbi:RHS repeat-associated protein [Hydrogenispora ethanolica]|uniref:RHS repeat-associated protein n=2 Tax=Hydrogenispora ethanolica TaxID=1082276 RepID=A0A4R1QPX2_HYDET|nr:RHS repeat-associated protein [Hydrogenispora ethanolica]